MTADLSVAEARRIALAAQGFSTPRPNGPPNMARLSAVVDRIGLIQLDSVNVVVRSHYMPFYSRLGPYERPLVEEMAFGQRRQFEYWGHAASLIPMRVHPFLRYRMRAATPRHRVKRLIEQAPGYVEAVLDEVREKGPIASADLNDPGSRTGPWWGYNDGKTALEWHFLTGATTTSTRRNFTRYYDLSERVIPDEVLSTPDVPIEEAHRTLLTLAAHCHGVGTARDLADYFRIRPPDARARLKELVESGTLRRVRVEGWREPAYLYPDAALPAEVTARALLSPFDSLVWERERVERLFNFNYRIEIYVPEPKRRYGYYVMPFLLGDELVARVDLKAERDRATLRVKGAFLEEGRDESLVAPELAAELRLMANWLGLEKVAVGRRGDLVKPLRDALKK